MRRLFSTATLLLLLLFCISSIAAADAHSYIIYGNNHAFMIKPPRGWVLDDQSGLNRGLYAVFYPAGLSWDTSTTVMYVNTAGRENSEALSSFIEEDIYRFKQRNPSIQVEEGEPTVTEDGKTAEIRYFSNDKWGNSEAVAYVPQDNIFALIVLTSRNKTAFDAAKPAFDDLVRSYFFVSSEAIIEHK